jgi:hypothetical protein
LKKNPSVYGSMTAAAGVASWCLVLPEKRNVSAYVESEIWLQLPSWK